VAAITERVARLDEELKVRGGEHAAARGALAAALRKQTGSLAVRDLGPLLATRTGPPLPSSDNLTTVGVVVGRGADREFAASYESLADYVVPRSATLLAEGLRLDWPVLDAVLITTVAASTLVSLGAYVRQLARGR
jgi:V-type H+-transporting ATPase subunit C